MPRDKKLSHKKVLDAAKKEFLEKGFEDASIRLIGDRAGMTSAGIYRHCKDKEDLFVQIVDPLLQEMNRRFAKHKKDKTVLIIAHRMRTIANADKIVVFKDREVAEFDSPDRFIETDGIYKHMIQLQNVSENWKMAYVSWNQPENVILL